jgi:hypothetical protein
VYGFWSGARHPAQQKQPVFQYQWSRKTRCNRILERFSFSRTILGTRLFGTRNSKPNSQIQAELGRKLKGEVERAVCTQKQNYLLNGILKSEDAVVILDNANHLRRDGFTADFEERLLGAAERIVPDLFAGARANLLASPRPWRANTAGEEAQTMIQQTFHAPRRQPSITLP